MVRGTVGLLALSSMVACSAVSASDGETASPAPVAEAKLTVFPQHKADNVDTDALVTVGAVDGTLQSVKVRAAGGELAGDLSADGTRWRSVRTARPGTTYTVTAVAVNPQGRKTETKTTFTTDDAERTFDIERMLPNKDETDLTVGVGMPIMIEFSRDITDRVAVERNLIVRSSKPVEGAWHWFDDRHIDFRPKTYWPAHTRVRLEARLAGVAGGDGLYGKRDHVLNFKIGREQITKGNIDNHHLTVRRNGKAIREIPMSAGQGGAWKYYTTSGVHLAMSREPVTIMISPGIGPGQAGYYRKTVYNTVRISNSGEYVHSAPWSVGSQGYANVSHGCVNVSPSHASWFIRNTLIGDPIVLTGTPRKLEPTNGWGHWQEDWKQWLKWSSTKSFPTGTL
ncbi:L,D-transpeptidase [Nonomuraea soli]|uniref:Lipoprotein-anchoring transpeptidase ErfK/SrfK n=1 Tax=Nonomuraea soli TaxID=1032476 RepID=A0A7W0CEE1_9ACTN|nr:Ig-like domain-containing protein [Nonomuraea soli]MBA2889460.1 lipoprotein-anchoring transpeptidase ErfK/SrfK [Nonomuraea soli]